MTNWVRSQLHHSVLVIADAVVDFWSSLDLVYSERQATASFQRDLHIIFLKISKMVYLHLSKVTPPINIKDPPAKTEIIDLSLRVSFPAKFHLFFTNSISFNFSGFLFISLMKF